MLMNLHAGGGLKCVPEEDGGGWVPSVANPLPGVRVRPTRAPGDRLGWPC